MKMLSCFTIRNLYVSLKISGRINQYMCPFPFRNFSQQESKHLHNFSPVVAARSSLHSIFEVSLIPVLFTRNPSFKFKILMVLCLNSGSGYSAESRGFEFRTFHKPLKVRLLVIRVQQLEKIFSLKTY